MRTMKMVRVVAASGLSAVMVTSFGSAQAHAASTKTVKSGNISAKLDNRCLKGRAVCIDKTKRKLYWVVNGKIIKAFDTRIGRKGMETKEGAHQIYWKHKNHVSSIYGSAMPYSQFFYKGQAIHQNPEWAKRGYGVGSHGCANLKTLSDAKWLWDRTKVGDKVIVYRSK